MSWRDVDSSQFASWIAAKLIRQRGRKVPESAVKNERNQAPWWVEAWEIEQSIRTQGGEVIINQ